MHNQHAKNPSCHHTPVSYQCTTLPYHRKRAEHNRISSHNTGTIPRFFRQLLSICGLFGNNSHRSRHFSPQNTPYSLPIAPKRITIHHLLPIYSSKTHRKLPSDYHIIAKTVPRSFRKRPLLPPQLPNRSHFPHRFPDNSQPSGNPMPDIATAKPLPLPPTCQTPSLQRTACPKTTPVFRKFLTPLLLQPCHLPP